MVVCSKASMMMTTKEALETSVEEECKCNFPQTKWVAAAAAAAGTEAPQPQLKPKPQ